MESGSRFEQAALLRLQSLVSLTLLFVVLLTAAGLYRLGSCDRLFDWIRAEALQGIDERSVVFVDKRGFLSSAHRVFHSDVPSVNHRQGGVFLFGASNLVSGMLPWTLEGTEQDLIHNYAIAGASLSNQTCFVKYLADYRGLLDKKEKTLIVFGMTFEAASEMRFFGEYFKDGIFQYSEEGGLHPVPMSEIEHAVRYARLRISNLLSALRLTLTWSQQEGFTVHKPTRHRRSEALLRDSLVEQMGETWEQVMDEQLAVWAAGVEAVLEGGARVSVVLMPTASWGRGLPYLGRFRNGLEGICGRLSIPMHDLTLLVPDDEYADHAHYRLRGASRLHEALLGIAREHLKSAGLVY